ncbi:DUF4328 domain-containing protein [Streptomyces glaucosporus]
MAEADAPDGQPWWVLSEREARAGERRVQRETPPHLRFEPTRTLAAVTVALLGVCAAADAFSLAVSVWRYTLVRGEAGSPRYGADPLMPADLLYAAPGLLWTLALVATAIPFLMWFHRSRLNAEAFDAAGQRMGAGWAVGAWFVPVANLWLPKRIADDVWDASSPPGADGTVRYRASRGPLNAWWALWLAANVLSGIAGAWYEEAETFQEAGGAAVLNALSGGVGVLAAVLAIRFVRRLTGMQYALHAHRLALAAEPTAR